MSKALFDLGLTAIPHSASDKRYLSILQGRFDPIEDDKLEHDVDDEDMLAAQADPLVDDPGIAEAAEGGGAQEEGDVFDDIDDLLAIILTDELGGADEDTATSTEEEEGAGPDEPPPPPPAGAAAWKFRRGKFGTFTLTPKKPKPTIPYGAYQARCRYHRCIQNSKPW